MKIIVYTATLPKKILLDPNSTSRKLLTLKNFAQGVVAAGDDGILSNEMVYQPCDVAVMLGWVHDHGKVSSHLKFRKELVDRQAQSGGRVVVADSNLFLYKDTTNPHNYLRYSFDGVFPNTGEYCDANPDGSRWEAVQRDMSVSLRDWRVNGDHVLLCLQRNGGWSMGGSNVVDWCLMTVKYLRKHTDRPLRIRAHPGDKNARSYCQDLMNQFKKHGFQNVTFSAAETPLTRDLKNCWAMVNHNSSPAVGAAIEGIPIFVTDPQRSQAREVANFNLSRIESPVLFERLPWVQRISQFHWSNDDLTSGRCWQHMRNWAKK